MFGGAASRYFMYTAVLYNALFEFYMGFVGLEWVTIMGRGTKRLKTTGSA